MLDTKKPTREITKMRWSAALRQWSACAHSLPPMCAAHLGGCKLTKEVDPSSTGVSFKKHIPIPTETFMPLENLDQFGINQSFIAKKQPAIVNCPNILLSTGSSKIHGFFLLVHMLPPCPAPLEVEMTPFALQL